jgi:hypothetical protein
LDVFGAALAGAATAGADAFAGFAAALAGAFTGALADFAGAFAAAAEALAGAAGAEDAFEVAFGAAAAALPDALGVDRAGVAVGLFALAMTWSTSVDRVEQGMLPPLPGDMSSDSVQRSGATDTWIGSPSSSVVGSPPS